MPNRVKGITVEIGGDTTGLHKALKSVEKEIKSTESTLKDVNKLLKLDPKNTELLAQKQKLLQQEIEQTEDKLKALKNADKQAKAQLDSGDLGQDKYDALQREIVETENKLKSLKSTAGSGSATLAKVSTVTGEFGNKAKSLGQSLMPATIAIAGVGAASSNMAMDFEDAMSQAAGALNKPMSEMDSLRQLAIQVGKDTVFSATDAGNAITELAKGGLTEADIQAGALQTTMDLAASSGMELGDAANVVVQAMGAFGLSANESAEAANALAGAAAASSTDVEPLTQGLAQCSAQAKNAGWDIQETTAALGMFADAGITGSDAGTSLKTMLQRLAAPTDTAAAEIEKLGIQTRDSQGNLLGASEMAQELQSKLGGLDAATRDAALQTIFGSDATRAATVMMSNGAAGIQKYITATNDQTAAQRLANSQMGETSKAIEEMKGSLETAAISIGETIAPVVQKVADFISDLANKFSELPSGIQTVIIVIAAIVAALGPLLIIVGQISIGISALTGAFSAMTVPMLPIIGIIAGIVAAIVAIIAIIKNWGAITEWFGNVWDTICSGLQSAWKTVKAFFTGIPEWWKGIWSEVIDTIKQTWESVTDVISSTMDLIQTTITSAWDTVTNAISNAMNEIQSVIVTVWNTILSNPVVQTIVTTVQNVFTTLSSTLQGIWNGIQTVATGSWEMIKNVILGPILVMIDLITGDFTQLASDLQNIWNNLINAAATIWNGITTVIISIVSGIVNTVVTFFTGLASTLASICTGLANALASIWDGILNAASSIWSGITSVVSTIVSGLVSAVTSLFSGLKSAVSSIWNGIKSAVSNAVNTIKSAAVNGFNAMVSGIKSAVSGISSAVINGFNSAISFITSLPGKAVAWGRDFIDGLKEGIMSGISGIVDAIKGIGDKIRSFLHFSRPDEGPLRDYETWMPDMMKGLAKGIYDNLPVLDKAVSAVARSINYEIMKDAPAQSIDYARMYNAVKAGASDSSTVLYIGDREFKRVLKGMGVAFE